MEDISSILLVIFALLSLGIRLFRKANVRPEEPEPPMPARKNRESVSAEQEEETAMPIGKTYDAPSMTEGPTAEPMTKTLEMPEKPSISDDFDLTKAVIYSEILKTRTFDEF
ncbi:MAG: hypothetical protein NC250_01855 [Alistipes senegalensis]|nr:hypothetical protein [Bacteroides cellulosilyticus]MCM1351462.1 hypothetical protein [Alistipes senegalensis]